MTIKQEFDKQFPGFMQLGTNDGGYDPRPYIIKFIEDKIHQCYLECVAVESGEGPCAEAIKSKFDFYVISTPSTNKVCKKGSKLHRSKKEDK